MHSEMESLGVSRSKQERVEDVESQTKNMHKSKHVLIMERERDRNTLANIATISISNPL